jgi:GDP-L-fucose synthase
MDSDSKIYVAGHRGLSGSALIDSLRKEGYNNIVTKTKNELDLRNQKEVKDFFEYEKIEYVFDCAAKVGGIHANSTYPAEFIYDNLMIQTNLIHSAYESKVKKFLFLGSVCIYPKFAPLPIVEDCLLTGFLEPTNEAYAVAKIAGIKMCQAYKKQYGFNAISLMPTNLYGPGDNYHPENSHVMAAMIRRFHDAKVNSQEQVYCWGDGSSKREFLYSYDLASACIMAMKNYEDTEIMNVSTGKEYTIKEVAETVSKIIGYEGEIFWDTSKPNGTIKRPLYIQKIKDLGWSSSIELEEGVDKAYSDFLKIYSK